MKTFILKSLLLVAAFTLATTDVSAQKFLKKLEKFANKTEEVVNALDANSQQPAADAAQQDTANVDPKEMLANAPLFSVKKVTQLGEAGDTLKNEDGTVMYQYLLFDQNGKVCERNTARKELGKAMKSFGIVLAKVGGGTALSALSKGKKFKLKDGLIGAGVGLLASAGDIKKMKEHVVKMKACRKVLKAYETTFTEEGTPIDASVDLTNVDGINFTECEEITCDANKLKQELMQSKEAGESLEEIDFDALEA